MHYPLQCWLEEEVKAGVVLYKTFRAIIFFSTMILLLCLSLSASSFNFLIILCPSVANGHSRWGQPTTRASEPCHCHRECCVQPEPTHLQQLPTLIHLARRPHCGISSLHHHCRRCWYSGRHFCLFWDPDIGVRKWFSIKNKVFQRCFLCILCLICWLTA